ncbi:MAG: histidine phosphatase family protein [Solirubrobacteraceae bacterium]
MSSCVWLLRHGDTEWTEEELHTGRRDVSLSDQGRAQARRAGRLLRGRHFTRVLVSPLVRAQETCRLAGFGDGAERCEDLVEWDYGDYEGLSDEETQGRDPGWNLFVDGAPGGETPTEVTERVERVIAAVSAIDGTALLVAHGKLLRALAARWIGFDIALGAMLPLDPAAISVLEREAAGPLLRLWNFTELTPAD